ncbi:MAG TPA: L-threonylcarbamoyladenylate synthase [Chitinophagaceae bacterium]|jgi:L-threonylcarbamoyladenylate synthase|nr:L-threonylcarbamoyladenylate synthase [Chitinophagaceae bacterium]
MKIFEKDIEKCLETLKAGDLILYPTDTVWGIGCDATNEEAVEKIYKLKRRSDEKAMIVLVADERNIMQHVAAPDLSLFDYLDKTTRPTTVVYEGALGFADNIVANDGSIAIRICKDDFCRQLIKRFRKPIVSTSANISGMPSPKIFKEITDEIKKGVDYVVEYKQQDEISAQPSSLIKWNNGNVTILRP